MEYGQMMNQAKENAKLAFYQNPSYQLERREKKTVILDVSHPLTDPTSTMPTEFNVKLLEPLIVDRLSDVYLDSFITTNAIANTTDLENIGFTLKINEFNINSNVASNQDKTPTGGYDSRKFNSIFIPNADSTSTTVGDGVKASVSHKAKKFNYIASINPCTISSLSGEILDAGSIVDEGPPIYASPFNSGKTRFIAEFMIVARD
tara:strand:- start:2001 stop:2615 length:615 start_codon:yes stop_codon:yes gene_type:complete